MRDWILQNKTWLFSGAGLTALGVAWWFFKKLFSSNPPNLNITVSPTISPVFSPNQSNTQNSPAAQSGKHTSSQQSPDIQAITFRAAFARAIGRSCFVIPFRNDGSADATNVIAHIAYVRNGETIIVDYGCWVEHELILNIGRGHTRNLIVAVTDSDGKNFAVNDMGPATNYTQAMMDSVGELKVGDWKMTVTIAGDNFRRNYVFDFRVESNGRIQCNREGMNSAPGKHDRATTPYTPGPNIGAMRPEIARVDYDPETDVWSKGNGEISGSAALIPLSNEPQKLNRTASVGSLRARLTYYKSDHVEEFLRIDSGCWLTTAYRFKRIEPGDIAYLIAAFQGRNGTGAIQNPRYSSARYSEDHTDVHPLPAGSYELKVDLFGGDNGEYSETFWFELEVGEQLQIKRLNQRTTVG